MTWTCRVALAVAVFYAVSALTIMVFGPWRLELGPLTARSSSLARPFMNAVVAGTIAFSLSPGARAAVRSASVLGFYLLAGALAWLCALGPLPVVNGESVEYPGLFAAFTALPGFSSLRVPGRFWLVATICLAVVAGLAVQALLRRRVGMARVVLVTALSLGVLSDGWEMHLPFGPCTAWTAQPRRACETSRCCTCRRALSGRLPHLLRRAARVDRSVNGYSGFEPTHYDGVRYGAKQELDGVFHVLPSRGRPPRGGGGRRARVSGRWSSARPVSSH